MTQAPADPSRERELREKIRAGSQELDDYHDLVHLLFSSGRPEEVVPLYRQALKLSLTHVQRARVSVELGWTLLDAMGKEAEARTLAEDAISLLANEPEDSEVLFVRGEGRALLASSVWRRDETAGTDAAWLALAALECVIAESPDLEQVTQALRDAARLQNLLGKPEMAIPLCEKALERDLSPVGRLHTLITLSDALLDANRPGEAGQVVDEAFQYLEGDKGALPRLHFQRGLVLRAMSRPAEARESFRQGLKALQSHPPCVTTRGTLWRPTRISENSITSRENTGRPRRPLRNLSSMSLKTLQTTRSLSFGWLTAMFGLVNM